MNNLALYPHELAAYKAGRLSLIIRPIDPQPYQKDADGVYQFLTNDGMANASEKEMIEGCPFGRLGDEIIIKKIIYTGESI